MGMVKFLETTGVTYELTELIKKSKEKLWLVSPYIEINDQIRGHIISSDARNVDIRVIFLKDYKINPADLSFLNSLKMKHLLECPNLHAKCYLNENTAIITSMNLYDYSQTHNREIGIKIDREIAEDKGLYDEIYQEMLSILNVSEPFQYEVKRVEVESPIVQKTVSDKKNYLKQTPVPPKENVGYCIRCGSQIELNPDKPLCSKCYPNWAKYADKTYPEKYCHVCGKESKQSVEKPICYSCYKKLKK
jgi:phosphatidylserine/phosphatidylglycerophosphate/cardiolipin synthase-like enzyme